MPIVYALIARKKSVLAEYTASSGNFPTVTRVLLSKIPEQDSKMSYVYDKHIFHFIVDNGITFLCMTDESLKRRIAFAFLEDIKSLFREKYSQIEETAIAFSLNEAFSPILKQRIEYFSSEKTNSKTDNVKFNDNLTRVQKQIDDVKDVMVENIDRVMQRGEVRYMITKVNYAATNIIYFYYLLCMKYNRKLNYLLIDQNNSIHKPENLKNRYSIIITE